jgi:hypothetical protein
VAQPGISGNTADQRLASGSNSTNNRNFIIKMITLVLHRSKLTDKTCADTWKAEGSVLTRRPPLVVVVIMTRNCRIFS